VRVTDAEILPEIRRRLPLGWRPSSSQIVDHLVSVVVGGGAARVRRFHILYADAERIARTLSRPHLLRSLESYLEQAVIERTASRVFLHAGTVGWRGRAILIPGASHAGKTRLVAELLRAGATYYSDEYAVIDTKGYVHPYPRPLFMRGDGGPHLDVGAAALGACTARGALPVGLVALAPYRRGARWRPSVLRGGRAVLALLAHALAARARPLDTFAALESVVRRARVLEGVRGEAKAMAAWLIRQVEASPSQEVGA
jgi:hypothetical protein